MTIPMIEGPAGAPLRADAAGAAWTSCRRRIVLAGLALLLCFAFLGSRPMWDPDEGRYSNVALTMLDSGNWIDPMRNAHTGHWTKPPMTYWLVAASAATFGRNPFAARLPIALAYLASIVLAYLIARHLARGAQTWAAIVYATMLMPFVAGQFLTTDFVMAALQALAVYGFVLYRFGERRYALRGLLLLWTGLALAFLAKGPPALIPLVIVALFHALAPRPERSPWQWHVAGLALFAALALPWYAWVVNRHEGLLSYFVGAEVLDRVATDRFKRNGEWYGWIKVYLPTLLLGTLPWTGSVWRWVRGLRQDVRPREGRKRTEAEARNLFLALWVAVPIVIFCLARSRLPLYVLPVFVPLAIGAAKRRWLDGGPWPSMSRLTAWVMCLLAIRLASTHYPTTHDANAWAEAIRQRAARPVAEVVFVDDSPRYGLHLHLGASIRRVSQHPWTATRFNPAFDGMFRDAVVEDDGRFSTIYVVRQEAWDDVAREAGIHGRRAAALGAPYEGRIVFELAR